MVQGYKQHRYFVRRGTRTVPMSEDEVRAAYEAARLRADKLSELLATLPLLPRIGRNRNTDKMRLIADGLTPPDEWPQVVSVVVAPFDAPPELASPIQLADGFPEEPASRYIAPNRRVLGFAPHRLDALGLTAEVLSGDDDAKQVDYRLRLYRAGVLEWAYRYPIPEPNVIPSTSFAEDVYNVLTYFASIFEGLGYGGRVAVFVRIDNAEHAVLSINQRLIDWPKQESTGMEMINAYRETTVDALLADPMPAVRSAMDLIWQAFGYRSCLLFDASGQWRRIS
ncbi:MAG: hypothetical protein QOH08_141 [Chloroflexota bacterium]|nr:hypothetical protein [Chloroflexota bacterium]